MSARESSLGVFAEYFFSVCLVYALVGLYPHSGVDTRELILENFELWFTAIFLTFMLPVHVALYVRFDYECLVDLLGDVCVVCFLYLVSVGVSGLFSVSFAGAVSGFVLSLGLFWELFRMGW